MFTRDEFFAWLASEPGKAALAGAAGGIVRWITLRSNWREGVGALIVGMICALYLGPLALPLLEPTFGAIAPSSDTQALSGFVMGITGIALAGIIMDVTSGFLRRRNDDRE